MTDDDRELGDLIRRTLHERAELTPRVVGRRLNSRAPRRYWATLAAAGVVAVGTAGAFIATTRSDGEQNETTPSPDTSLPAGVLLTPPPDTPGLEIRINEMPQPGGAYTTGVVSSPDGTVVILQNDPGEFPERMADSLAAEVRNVDGGRVVTWANGFERTYALESPCSNTTAIAATDDDAWSGDLNTLVEATTIDSDGAMTIELPDGWTSYGAGLMGPGFSYRFTIPIDGTPTTFTVLQRFDTQIGATFRNPTATPLSFNGVAALTYGDDHRGIHYNAGPDSISLSGPVDTDTLIEVASALDRYNTTVDLAAARSRFPTIEFTDCQRTITITTD
jgi:hypothetical protein